MENNIILGYASSMIGLLRLLSSERSGVIIIEKMIECDRYEFNCYPNVILRGANENCGLSFTMDIFCAPSLRMHQWSALENLTIDIHAKKISRDLNFGGILIQGYGVVFHNVRLNLTAEEPLKSRSRSFAALYLLHELKVENKLSISVAGEMAVAVKGNNTSLARMKVDNANLTIKAEHTLRQTIKKCLVEVSGMQGRLDYDNETIAEDDFVNAYVLLSDGADVFSTNKMVKIDKQPYDYDGHKIRLRIITNWV